MRRAVLALVVLVVASGCADPPPDTIETSAIDPSTIGGILEVDGNGSAVVVGLSWYARSDTSKVLVLGAGDRLVVRATDAAPRDLTRVGQRYFALLPTTATTITVALVRPSGERAVDVALPPAFTVKGPTGIVPRSLPFDLTWDQALWDAPTQLRVTSPCFATIRRQVAQDTGTFTFFPGDFATGTPSCTLAITVTRTTVEALPKGNALGLVGSSSQHRTIQLETTP